MFHQVVAELFPAVSADQGLSRIAPDLPREVCPAFVLNLAFRQAAHAESGASAAHLHTHGTTRQCIYFPAAALHTCAPLVGPRPGLARGRLCAFAFSASGCNSALRCPQRPPPPASSRRCPRWCRRQQPRVCPGHLPLRGRPLHALPARARRRHRCWPAGKRQVDGARPASCRLQRVSRDRGAPGECALGRRLWTLVQCRSAVQRLERSEGKEERRTRR